MFMPVWDDANLKFSFLNFVQQRGTLTRFESLETAEKLSGYSYDEIKPIVPELLTWIQDMNWPVARPVADYLGQSQNI